MIIEFGSPSGAASNLGLTIVTLADFSDDDYNPPTPPLSACQNHARYSKYHKYTQIPILRNSAAA